MTDMSTMYGTDPAPDTTEPAPPVATSVPGSDLPPGVHPLDQSVPIADGRLAEPDKPPGTGEALGPQGFRRQAPWSVTNEDAFPVNQRSAHDWTAESYLVNSTTGPITVSGRKKGQRIVRVWVPAPITTQPANTTQAPGNPAAGANFQSTPPGTSPLAQVVAIQFTLTTSATVANRLAAVTINGVMYSAGVAQTASLVETYTFAPGEPLTTVLPATGGQLTAPIPPGLYASGANSVASAIAGIQAGDQISAIHVVYAVPASSSALGVVVSPVEGDIQQGAGITINPGDPFVTLETEGAVWCGVIAGNVSGGPVNVVTLYDPPGGGLGLSST